MVFSASNGIEFIESEFIADSRFHKNTIFFYSTPLQLLNIISRLICIIGMYTKTGLIREVGEISNSYFPSLSPIWKR